jgi:lysophospholipase L1-like esterase
MNIARVIAAALLISLAACATNHAARKSQEKGWYSAWAMAHNARAATPNMSGRTVRMILNPSISGTAVRVKIENTMGEAPVVFSAASMGIAGTGAAVREGTLARLTFGGQPGLTLAPGAGAYSDPLPFKVTAFEKLALSLQVQSAGDLSTHHVGLRTNWSAAGARAADASATGFEPLPEIAPLNSGQWPYYWVAALDVQSSDATSSIVLFADSITDGRCSTRDDKGIVQANLDQRWGDVMAARLAARAKSDRSFHKAIAISSISGNRVLGRGNGPSAFERLERDVLDRAGVTHVVFFMGTNDIAGNFTAAQVIAGTQQIIALVRSRGIKIIGVTMVPRGRPAPEPGWTSAHEKERLAANDWIRHKAGFDGVIDFDALMKNSPLVKLADGGSAPAMPAAWNCDYTHPNAAGYQAMGEFVDLNLFR